MNKSTLVSTSILESGPQGKHVGGKMTDLDFYSQVYSEDSQSLLLVGEGCHYKSY